MRTENCLVELGTEELPPKALKSLGEAFAIQFEAALSQADLSFDSVSWFAAPRRLAVYVSGLAEGQADKVVEKRGPAVSAAFDADGNPTKAAQGWARGNGIDVSDAERLVTDKGEWLLHKAHVPGQTIAELLEGLINQAVSKLPIPKPMRWGNYNTQFIRPVHTLCVLYGSEVVNVSVLGLTSGRVVQGHRFHGEGRFELDHADNYASALEKQYVLADFEARKDKVRQQLEDAAKNLSLKPDYDEELLEEIASLVEWPVVLQAGFDKGFLEVPKEALIYTMKDDQKYVPLLDSDCALSNTFLFVTNIESHDASQVISGNEKVIRPRLADAEFFFNSDKKTTLESRLESLETVLFQKQLGTLKEKSERISALSAFIASQIDANETQAARAGLLAKTDLMSNMVMEFPDVQGVMGKYYALNDGEDAPVAEALYEQYMPRFAGDALPSSGVSASVALADKLDTLVGIFGIGQLPKGDKDPFALRRAAIGVLRIVTELSLPLDLETLVSKAIDVYGDKLTNAETQTQVVDFVLGRFNALLQDQAIAIDVIQAVAARRPTKPSDYLARVHAVDKFKALEEAEALAAANKRVANILAKQNVEVTATVNIDESLLAEDAEKALYVELKAAQKEVEIAVPSQDYTRILTTLATLRNVIDNFFDNVMVMADDEAVKHNRLALLSLLRQLFLTTADISILAKS
ncbi:glycine--tRNA ligase subunit beta [Alteromonas mediterranea]|uniref:Glycine--tRNA ligase beta subunit n=1 Tax=Alteromonas mediterranea TaxID=314275 RepID=A0AAC9AC66_9ALTE|nr:glycine--tRNA ligase subunit beta [Alteromonas mediterranea]AFV83539.1 glycyl-tRNA ligase subunit beta [Alteromonas mediterranea DE1]AGP95553.1 glycyl-tRNA ligase subunit beta [Alteromonas mediterranea UM7]AGP99883.1 glycyl-tRNA ligase subunit beta [Alteromonas mediterranea UM4b]AMJ76808.1 glycine--tRNA ligase subunit beta [Alteromonas mediterranea]AMJ80953.1 glycine--tRNA ligase subunit beta [Alteromonas mediterranea]